jgi:hypothetical protein
LQHLVATAQGVLGDADEGHYRGAATFCTKSGKRLSKMSFVDRRRRQQIRRDHIALAAASMNADLDQAGFSSRISIMCHTLGADAVRPGLGDLQTPASCHEVYKQLTGPCSQASSGRPECVRVGMNFTVAI